MPQPPKFSGVYLFVRDLDASVAFYRRLGLEIDAPPDSGGFARADLGNGMSIEFGTAAITRRYDPHWQEPSGPATNTLNFDLPSPQTVDGVYADLVAAGYTAHLPPIDAFWGARYAIVDDPDGNLVGLHGPR